MSAARLLFGHQSVGRDILAGVALLASELGTPLRIEEIASSKSTSGNGLFHLCIGNNGEPQSKLDAFTRQLDRLERPHYDLAAMKFCYVDLGLAVRLDAAALFDRYAQFVDELAERRPDVTLMHITMPLRADQGNWKTAVKRFVGRHSAADTANAARNVFNDALRKRYAHAPLFDLATVESTHLDGRRSSFSLGRRSVYTLASEYTNDGGHLNTDGQRLVATAFVQTLADTLRGKP